MFDDTKRVPRTLREAFPRSDDWLEGPEPRDGAVVPVMLALVFVLLLWWWLL